MHRLSQKSFKKTYKRYYRGGNQYAFHQIQGDQYASMKFKIKSKIQDKNH